MTLVARHGALSDIGLHRKTNEDAFEAQPPLYVVCDGMGGANAGEVASGLAVETLVARATAGDSLLEAAEAANTAVFERASANPEQAGMGTTLTAFLLEGSAAHFVHIGDSRAYLLRDGGLEQLSDDHSLVGEMVRDGRLTVDEAAAHPHRSILSRALGTEARAKIDEFSIDLLPGDVLLLCSDGLSGPVSNDALRLALTRGDPREAAGRLVQEARRQGGPDNITAVVVRVDEAMDAGDDEVTLVAAVEDDDTAELPFVVAADEDDDWAGAQELDGDAADALAATAADLHAERSGDAAGAAAAAVADASRRRRRSARRLGAVAAVLTLLTVAAAAGAFFLSTLFFIGVDDGRLAIYSGVPVELGPIPLHAVYRRSVVTYDSLSPSARTIVDEQRLRDRTNAFSVSDQLGMWP